MKTLQIILVLLLCSAPLAATTVFSERYAGSNVVKVYVTEYESQADLKVFKVQYSSQASRNDG
ncbi:MAG TPA: hypothetical protein PLD82_09875, partial [Spirochaetota bacterium]|nr:hypothetical protein [Spirochaetota bacterium]